MSKLSLHSIAVACIVTLVAGVGYAADRLTDEELDQVSAHGTFSVQLLPPLENGDVPGVNLQFETGDTVGAGEVILSPNPQPSTIINGNPLFQNTLLNVQNLIMNMNICVQCRATTILQSNQGVPIEIHP